ncbi:hypothetical protein DSECCO2_612120 [anaerobic digester metagenome]
MPEQGCVGLLPPRLRGQALGPPVDVKQVTVRQQQANATGLDNRRIGRGGNIIAVAAHKPYRQQRPDGAQIVDIRRAVAQVQQQVNAIFFAQHKAVKCVKIMVSIRDNKHSHGIRFLCSIPAVRPGGVFKSIIYLIT